MKSACPSSGLAGVSLYYLAGLPTHDVTNSFKMYRKEWLDRLDAEQTAGESQISAARDLHIAVLGPKLGPKVPQTCIPNRPVQLVRTVLAAQSFRV